MFKNNSAKLLIAALSLVIFSHSIEEAKAEESDWSKEETRLTREDFIRLYFACHLENYQTTEKLKTYFIPNGSPGAAVLYLVKPVVVPESDLPTRADLEGSLKQKALLYRSHVDQVLKDPSMKKRWPDATPKNNLIIHFVDSHAPKKKTVALFVGDKFVFDQDQIKTALEQVKKRVGETAFYGK